VRNDGRGTLLAHARDAIRGDGSATAVLMREAYGWALQNPVRRTLDNMAVATLSVALAMILGTVLLLQMAARALGLSNGFLGPVQSLDLRHLGYGMVAVSIAIWPGATIV
jgi:nickel/cobalt transporter (NiCoT) family protein